MRSVTLDRPFVLGMVTDAPDWALGPQHSAFAQDGFSPSGVFASRRGWSYVGTTADVADNLVGIARIKFILNDNTRTVTGDDDGDLFVHNPAGAGTAIFTGTAVYLPRCVYKDELLWCAQDGTTPLRRYGGATAGATVSSGTPTWTDGEATITGMTLSGTPASGSYVSLTVGVGADARIVVHGRVLEGSTSSVTVDGYRATNTTSITGGAVTQTGLAYPAVVIYDAGTVTISAGAATGFGTDWSGAGVVVGDHMVVIPEDGSTPWHASIDASIGATSIGTVQSANQSTKSNYLITRALPFTDAASHKGSLWGSGVAQFPSRVYVFPPDWNMSMPPGYPLPMDPTVAMENVDVNKFLADTVDVPSLYDGDDIVAILPSPSPLLVLKRKAVYGIYGSYTPGDVSGGFSRDMIADGIGCIDIRSAISVDEGQFWAGEGGVYWYTGGEVIDLTAGKINREWRALTRDFDYGTLDYCSMGVTQGHLIVHITTAGGTIQRTYLCDLRDRSWQSRISNFTPRYMFTSRVNGESEALLAVSDARQGRVLDFAPALDGSGTAKDDAGTAPVWKWWTGSGIGRANGIDGLTRFVDLDIHANIYDAGAAGATVVDVSTVHGGGPSNEATATKTLDAIDSDSADRIDRKPYRVGRRGRLHQIRGEVSTLGTDTNATKLEVHQIVASFRDNRDRS